MQKKGTDHFTFASKDKKLKKIVTKAAPGLKPEELMAGISGQKIINPIELAHMKTRNIDFLSHSYLTLLI